MPKTQYHCVGDSQFEGATKTEAREKAQAAIEAAFTGEYTPTLLFHRSHVLVIYRDQTGWRYRMIWPDILAAIQGSPIKANAMCYSSDESYEAVYKTAVSHLAQTSWDYRDGLKVPDFVEDKEDRATQEGWQRFQLRYRYFRQQGLTSDECHNRACDSRFWTPTCEELAAAEEE